MGLFEPLEPMSSVKNDKKYKKVNFFAKRFGSLKNVRTFAIPKQSGGGEMVDTLL